MQHEHNSDTENLRGLPVHGRVNALRDQIARRFGAKAVGFQPQQEPRKPQPHASHKRINRAGPFLVLGMAITFSLFRPAPAHAGTLDLNVNLVSVHTERWARNELNQVNPGVGLTYHFDCTWALMSGEYLNSYRCPTWYALGAFTPLHMGSQGHWHVDAGLVAGLASGYTHRENVYAPVVAGVILRIAATRGLALNLLAVPNDGPRDSGFIGFQLSIPLRGPGGDQ